MKAFLPSSASCACFFFLNKDVYDYHNSLLYNVFKVLGQIFSFVWFVLLCFSVLTLNTFRLFLNRCVCIYIYIQYTFIYILYLYINKSPSTVVSWVHNTHIHMGVNKQAKPRLIDIIPFEFVSCKATAAGQPIAAHLLISLNTFDITYNTWLCSCNCKYFMYIKKFPHCCPPLIFIVYLLSPYEYIMIIVPYDGFLSYKDNPATVYNFIL